MSLESSIFAALSDAASDTAALVGSGDACRVYPGNAPAGTTVPYAVFQHIASDPDRTHDGASSISNDLVQFSCFGATHAAASALCDAIISDLDNIALSTGAKPILQDRRNTFETAVDLHRADADLVI